MRPFFIDTDTASDDAVALLIALRHPGIDVVAIGVVAGNVPLAQAVQNALYTRELVGRTDVPVYAGEAAPLVVPLHTAQNVHGTDGVRFYTRLKTVTSRWPDDGSAAPGFHMPLMG